MCDYSLYAIPNRLAEDGEQVVLYRFGSGTIGFASTTDVRQRELTTHTGWPGVWASIKSMLSPRKCPGVPAVCMPPGTRLMVTEIPKDLKAKACVRPGDTVVFTEISSQSYSYRDALLLPNGTCVLLQELPEGMQAVVISTALETSESPIPAEVYVR